MLVYSWNVNGIRAVIRKEIVPWRRLRGADVICLQETKAQPDQLEDRVRAPRGWKSFWHSAEKKGYSGTAIYSREEPDEIVEGLGKKKFDCEGRVIGARFGDVLVISAYFPNSQEAGARLDYKLAFCLEIERFLKSWQDRGCETVLTGDFNIAHEPIDLARPKPNEKNPGYLPEERAWMTKYIKSGYCDVFRDLNPDLEGAYTWWSMRSGARSRNIGWRLDYTSVSGGLKDRVQGAKIHPRIVGSDHCPVSIEIRA